MNDSSEPRKAEGQAADPGKIRVRVRLHSFAESQRTVSDMPGFLVRKQDCLYLRYEEPQEAQMGRTMTTMRLTPEEVRIIRHGDVRFEQTFAAGGRHIGYLDTAHGRMELEAVTHAFGLRLPERGGDLPFEASWLYELTVMGEAAGRVEVRLEVRAEEGS
ncbi:Uncharacterized beta-barrel protein YwiB, DUF1934 family [Paenibacillus sp. UNCCL117]|uniref:DUF1934 domain-containing protein n=1 Tax=unclassified Paenibacillus TaxID=185978 RepID=UPI00088F596A|nr:MULTISPECIES: DUF1934 domain-containing protein [unclassified Paenibacillus]SDD19177.1 Uncharacterized beta-barrel protein YwiB, DUF1934 family [Paenibacillus sp. cl123]SFW35446.1 Uncharacterized beta-barrel protein YwiB, DUF1934 family [Paenibacillus sp. UNCCL117]